jgi:hypothetical protein
MPPRGTGAVAADGHVHEPEVPVIADAAAKERDGVRDHEGAIELEGGTPVHAGAAAYDRIPPADRQVAVNLAA